jgi:hypothetical protein
MQRNYRLYHIDAKVEVPIRELLGDEAILDSYVYLSSLTERNAKYYYKVFTNLSMTELRMIIRKTVDNFIGVNIREIIPPTLNELLDSVHTNNGEVDFVTEKLLQQVKLTKNVPVDGFSEN